MQPSTAPGGRPGMPSAGGQGGCRGWPTWAGGTGWAGMQGAPSCWPSTQWGCSPAVVGEPPAPRINRWRRRFLPGAALPSRGWPVSEDPRAVRMASTRALRARRTLRRGGGPTAPKSSAHLGAPASGRGPSHGGAGSRASARLWRRSMSHSLTPFASSGNGPMRSAGCRRAWPRRSPGITSASGCMSNSAGRGWPLQTWWTGNLRGFHTKRLTLISAPSTWIKCHNSNVLRPLLADHS